MKFSVSLLVLSAFVFTACNTPVTRRSLYRPGSLNPDDSKGPWRRILREQSYLSGIDPEHLRPWTVKKKEEHPGSPLQTAPLPKAPEETVPPPTM